MQQQQMDASYQQQQQQQQHQRQHRGHKQRHRGHKQRQQHRGQHHGQHTETRQHKSKKGGRMVSKNRKVGRWFLGETLGKGGYSWVKKGYDRKDGRVVALKFTSKAKGDWSASQSKQIQNEIEALRQIKDKHVLQLLAYNLNAKYPQKDGLIIPSVLLVLEYLPGGELFDILYYTSALTETIARTYFKQLIEGMEAIHEAGICHRNIKPQNLLLDANFQLKIADFGLGKLFEKNEDARMGMRTFYVGTRYYQSPEILKKNEYTPACDVFSCGVVLFILLAGYPPFQYASPKCRWYAPLDKGNAREFWKQHRGCGIPGAAKDLITRMLWYDFNKRISICGIKKHKWYNRQCLNANELTSELRKLHHLMEIKRREDADKQKELQTSIDADKDYWVDRQHSKIIYDVSEKSVAQNEYCIKIWNQNKKPPSIRDRTQEYWEGDIIKNVTDVYKAYLKLVETDDNIDVLSIFQDECKSYDKSKRIIVVNHMIKEICDLPQITKNKNFRKYLDNKNNLYLELSFSTQEIKFHPPEYESVTHGAVTFKDIYTIYGPRYVLKCIQRTVIELGGTANINLKQAILDAGNLCTHSVASPVGIKIKMFSDTEKRCYLVKFERSCGSSVHFNLVLEQLTRQCGHCLTGVPKDNFTKEEKEQAKIQREKAEEVAKLRTNQELLQSGMTDEHIIVLTEYTYRDTSQAIGILKNVYNKRYNDNVVEELVRFGFGSYIKCFVASLRTINYWDINAVMDTLENKSKPDITHEEIEQQKTEINVNNVKKRIKCEWDES
eukprot:345353_1